MNLHRVATLARSHTVAILLLALVSPISLAGGQAVEGDPGNIRITAPMASWALPYDRPVAIAYFAIWPPCTPKPANTCTNAPDTCDNSNSGSGSSGAPCETRVLVNGQHILTHILTADNQFSFSGIMPAGALPVGNYEVSVSYVCKGPRELPPVLAASSNFSVVDPAMWEALGDRGEDVGDSDGNEVLRKGQEPIPAEASHSLASVPHESAPRAKASSAKDIGAEARGGAVEKQQRGPIAKQQRGVRSAVMIYHANVAQAYDARWIEKSILSILAQTHEEFDIYELNYGPGARESAPDKLSNKISSKFSVVAPHVHLLQGKHYTFLSAHLDSHAGTQFTCFTSTNLQNLTQRCSGHELPARPHFQRRV